MNIPMFFEKRGIRRRRLTGLLPGRLVVEDSEKDLPCRLIDVNCHGMGILSDDLLAPGTSLHLKTKDGDIALEVAWGQPDFGKQDLYRYGIKVLDQSLDLEAVFNKFGCFV